MSASKRASEKIDIMNRAADEVGDDYISVAAMSAVIAAEYEPLIESLRDMLDDCPYSVDQATVPKAGIDAAPAGQVVLNISCSLTRYRKLEELLAHIEGDATP